MFELGKGKLVHGHISIKACKKATETGDKFKAAEKRNR